MFYFIPNTTIVYRDSIVIVQRLDFVFSLAMSVFGSPEHK